MHAFGLKAHLEAEHGPGDHEHKEWSQVAERAKTEISPQELFQYKVLELIRLFYKFLIAGVIGFMCLHQGLDYLAARRKHAKKP